MCFSIFNTKLLKQHNTNKFLDSFTCLNDISLSALKEANIYYANIPELLIGLSGKKIEVHRQDMVQNAKEGNFDEFQRNKNIYVRDITNQKNYAWYRKQQETLRNDSFWKKLYSECTIREQKSKLRSLEKAWKRHSNFSSYTSQALVEAATTVLPVFSNYLILFKEELCVTTNKLPSHLVKELRNYGTKLENEIATERKGLCEAMLARLKLASEMKGLSYDDVTMNLVHELKKLNLLKNSFEGVKIHRSGLDTKTKYIFQDFISKYGTKNQCQALDYLSWNKSNDDFTIEYDKHGQLIVPSDLKSVIKPKGFIATLLGTESKNKKFLRTYNSLITQIRFLPHPKNEFQRLSDFDQIKEWHELLNLSNNVKNAVSLAEKNKPQGLFGRFFGNENIIFLSTWQAYLNSKQKEILTSALDYAEIIIEQLKTRIRLALDEDITLSRGFLNRLYLFQQQLASIVDNSCVTEENETFNVLASLIESLENKYNWSKYNKPNPNSGKEQAPSRNNIAEVVNPFKPISENFSELAAIVSIILTKQNTIDYKNLNFKDLIKNLSLTLDRHKHDQSYFGEFKSNISETIINLYKSYLQTWINSNELDATQLGDALKDIEALFLDFGPEFVAISILELRELIAKRWFVFQAKCHAMLVSLSSEFETEFHLNQLEKNLPCKHGKSSDSQLRVTSCSSAMFQPRKMLEVEIVDHNAPIAAY
jgi:hypothetical protein